MRQGGEPTPYHCDFNSLYKVQAAFECCFRIPKSRLHLIYAAFCQVSFKPTVLLNTGLSAAWSLRSVTK